MSAPAFAEAQAFMCPYTSTLATKQPRSISEQLRGQPAGQAAHRGTTAAAQVENGRGLLAVDSRNCWLQHGDMALPSNILAAMPLQASDASKPLPLQASHATASKSDDKQVTRKQGKHASLILQDNLDCGT